MRLNEILSYKEVCFELGDVQVKSGRNRELQLNRWNKIAQVDKVGRGKYVIVKKLSDDEIQLKEYTDNYSKFLQAMLLDMFAKQEQNKMTFTYKQLREYTKMVNKHYFPVKYGNENTSIRTNVSININNLFKTFDQEDTIKQEREWFNLADGLDKDAIKYALRRLLDRGLLVSVQETYQFFYYSELENGYKVYKPPMVASSDDCAEIRRRQLKFIKEVLDSKIIKSITNAKEDETEVSNKKVFGMLEREVCKHKNLRSVYFQIPKKYAKEIGYSGYAKAFTIVKVNGLESLISTFAPKFNAAQVQKYLNSKRFDNFPKELHEQLTNQLIKINE